MGNRPSLRDCQGSLAFLDSGLRYHFQNAYITPIVAVAGIDVMHVKNNWHEANGSH